MKRQNLMIVFIFASMVAQAQTQERPEFSKLKPEAQVLVLSWLNGNCGAGEQGKLEQQLKDIGAVLEPVFWEAYRLGPTRQELRNDTAAVVKRYADRQNWLRQFGEAQMGREETARQLAIPEKQYVDREVAQYVERYKTATLSGLGLIGTRRSEVELARIAGDEKNPAQTAAKEALKAIRRQNGR
jgi:hypothetical protein